MRTTVAAVFLMVLAAAPVQASDWRPDCLSSPLMKPAAISKSFGDHEFHDGIDFGVRVGTRVHAMAGGTVVESDIVGRGTAIIVIETRAGRRYAFAHLSRRYVRIGERVRRGQVLGLSGGIGPLAMYPHLHVSVLDKNGRQVDPLETICLPSPSH